MSSVFTESGNREIELARVAEEAGDREKAIRHYHKSFSQYQLAKSHEKKGSPLRTRLVRLSLDIIEKIKQLESGPIQVKEKSVAMVERDSQNGQEPPRTELFREVEKEDLPDLCWNDVIGLENVKMELKMTVQYPMEIPQIYVGNRKATNGILLYGPPGVGKTMIVKVLAKECGISFFSVSSSDIISKWVGDSPKNMKALFEKVKASKPAILFVDEIEALCPSRDSSSGVQHSGEAMKVVDEILTQMDGLTSEAGMKGVLVIGATNYPWHLDTAILRRFPRRIFLPLPGREDRFALLSHLLKKNEGDIGEPIDFDDIAFLADSTELFSNFDLKELIRFASNLTTEEIIQGQYFRLIPDGEKFSIIVCTEEEILLDPQAKFWSIPYNKLEPELKVLLKSRAVNMSHLKRAMKITKPVTSLNNLTIFQEWTNQHGSNSSL